MENQSKSHQLLPLLLVSDVGVDVAHDAAGEIVEGITRLTPCCGLERSMKLQFLVF